MSRFCLRLTPISARASVATSAHRWGVRRLHQRQALPYSIDEGLGKFLPPEALKVQLEYQDGLLERLNDQVLGTAEAADTIAQTVINLSGKRDKVLAFNYASLALNNSFFLNNLKTPSNNYPNYEHKITPRLKMSIQSAHGGIQQLRSAFSAAALGTFINGWVWFVADQAANTGIITTYGAGTLLVRSRSNMQKHPNFVESELYDASSPLSPISPSRSPFAQNLPPGTLPSSPLSGISGDNSPTVPKNTHARFIHNEFASIDETVAGLHSKPMASSRNATMGRILTAGEILYPLFCVPVYEHAWMSAGFGVWGKEQWLKEFWSVVNWERVDAAYNVIFESSQDRKHGES